MQTDDRVLLMNLVSSRQYTRLYQKRLLAIAATTAKYMATLFRYLGFCFELLILGLRH